MAAALDAGSYRLRHGTSTATLSTKRIIFVKLTDSAQTALEDLKLNKDRNRATFQLGEKDGCIRLPNGDVFNFRVDEVPNSDGPQGSFECIQTVRKGEVEHISDIKHRITVAATEASFQNTREKMTAADEKSKSQCAKKIETSTTGPNITQRSKVLKRPGDSVPLASTSNKKARADAASPHNSPYSKTTSAASSRMSSSSSSQPVIAPFAPSSQKRPPPAAPAACQPPPRTSSSSLAHSASLPSLQVPEQLQQRSASRSPLTAGSITAARSPVAPAVRPLRERLIQTLALKPMTKPDLIGKLRKFGYKDDERPGLDHLMSEVTTICGKDADMFDLLPGCWRQVDTKWSLYSPADGMMASKRYTAQQQQQLENRPSSGSSAVAAGNGYTGGKSASESVFPSSTSQSSSRAIASSSSAKNSTSKNNCEMDRLRVSLAHPNPGDDLSPPPPSNSSTCSTPSPPDHSKLKEIGNKNNNAGNHTKPTNASRSFASHEDPPSASTALTSLGENVETTVTARYPSIETPAQRRQYKNDFYRDYGEYKELHGRMAGISQQFTSWETQLKDTQKGSPAYQQVAERMRNEYKRLKKDDEYTAKRAQWEQLFHKLTVIKQQIKAYDVLHKKS